jgi:tetratricopeptide (TPR) repeat protein
VRDTSKALELDPGNTAAWDSRASAKLALKDIKGATADVEHSLALNPKNPKALDVRASIRIKQEDFAGALADSTRAIELDPRSALYWIRRSGAKSGLKDLAGCERDLDKAISLDPKSDSAFADRGYVRALLKRHEESIADYTKALELGHRQPAIILNNRAMSRKAKGDTATAIQDLEKAVALDPGYATAAKNLVTLKGSAPSPPRTPAPTGSVIGSGQVGTGSGSGTAVSSPAVGASEGARSPDALMAALEQALRAGSVDAAAQLVHPATRAQYRQLFASHRSDLPRFAEVLKSRASQKATAAGAEFEISEQGHRFTVVLRKWGDLWFVYDL